MTAEHQPNDSVLMALRRQDLIIQCLTARLPCRAATLGLCLAAIALIASGQVAPPRSVPLPVPRPSISTARPQPDHRVDAPANTGITQVNSASSDQTAESAGGHETNWPAWIVAISAMITALFSVVLSVAIVRLWSFTKGLLEETRRLSSDNITAAQQSAETVEKALTVLERPILFVEKIKFDPRATRPLVSLIVRNYGRTPANIGKFKASLRLRDHIPTASDEPSADNLPIDVIIGQGDSWESPSIECVDSVTAQRYAAIDRARVHFYVWGEVHYRDLFGNEHSTVFLRRLDRQHGQWEPVGGMERNYGE